MEPKGSAKFFKIALVTLALSTLFMPHSEARFSLGLYCAIQSLRDYINPINQETSVELELNTSPQVLRFLTTKDGTLKPLLDQKSAPDWLITKIHEIDPQNSDPKKFEWDRLDYEPQLMLLKYVANGSKGPRGQEFYNDRLFHGLVTRTHIELHFSETTEFLGQRYEPGDYLVDLSNTLMRKVEFQSADSVDEAAGFELHFRTGKFRAGQVSHEARKLLTLAGIEKRHQHVHIVSKLPIDLLKANPKLESIVMTDFFRRANMAAEMFALLAYDTSVQTYEKDGSMYFGPLSRQDLATLANFFQRAGKGKIDRLGSTLKMAWIGMRGPDAYDGKLLWGMEYRMLPHDTQSEAMIIMLNTLQASMATRDYGISRSQIQTWLERRFKWDWRKPWVFGEKVSDIVSSVHYNKDLETLVAEAPTELRPLYDQIREKQGKALDDHFNKMQELKMLLHDWSLDPNFMDQPELLANIRKEQIEILTTLSKRTLISDGNYIFFAQKFIRISGLYEATLKSLGLVSSVEAPK